MFPIRDPFEEMRRLLDRTGEAIPGIFQQQDRRDERDMLIERENAQRSEDIQREQDRFDITRSDKLTEQARSIIMKYMDELDEGMALLDPVSDADIFSEGLEARQYLLNLLGQSGERAFQDLSSGQRLTTGAPLGETIARARNEGAERDRQRQLDAEERARLHDRAQLMLNIDASKWTTETTQAFQGMLARMQQDHERGMQVRDIAAQYIQQARQFGFTREQNELERNLTLLIEEGRLGVRNRELDWQESVLLHDRLIEDVQGYDPRNPDDATRLGMVVDFARQSGMHEYHLLSVRSRVLAQQGTGAQTGFKLDSAAVESAELGVAGQRLANTAETYAQTRREIEDGQVDTVNFAEFLSMTAQRGSLGVPILNAIAEAWRADDQSSPYRHWYAGLNEEVLAAAQQRALDVAANQEIEQEAFATEARRAMIEGDMAMADLAARYYRPQDIQELIDLPDDDVRFSGPNGRTLRMVRDMFKDNPGMIAHATRLAYLRDREDNEPLIDYAMSQLQFLGSRRPNDVELGAEAVRSHLWSLHRFGLFGDPVDLDMTRELIEQTVGFYRQGWGDSAEAFRADLAESASRTALNNANAALAYANIRKINAEIEMLGGGDTINLEALKLYKGIVDAQIDGLWQQARTLGCDISSAVDRPSALRVVGGPEACAGLADEMNNAMAGYDTLLFAAGGETISIAQYQRLIGTLTQDVMRHFNTTDPNDPRVRTEVDRRAMQITHGYNVPLGPEFRETPPPAPTRRSDEGGAVGGAVGAAATALGGVGDVVEDAADWIFRPLHEFIFGPDTYRGRTDREGEQGVEEEERPSGSGGR